MRRKDRVSPEQAARAREMRLAGESYETIAKAVGVSYECAKDCTRDIPNRVGDQWRKSKLRNDEIWKLYQEGHTTKELAEQYGITEKYIRQLLKSREKPAKKTAGEGKQDPQKAGSGQQPPKDKQRCPHKRTCKYWRRITGNTFACHFPIDNDYLRPYPVEECPGFPGKKPTKGSTDFLLLGIEEKKKRKK